MPYPEIPSIPPIEICNDCTESPVLNFVNQENQRYAGEARAICTLLGMLEGNERASEVIQEGRSALDAARPTIESEAATIERVNAMTICRPGSFCARLLAYKATPGGVYLGQSYLDPKVEDIAGTDPPQPEQRPENLISFGTVVALCHGRYIC